MCTTNKCRMEPKVQRTFQCDTCNGSFCYTECIEQQKIVGASSSVKFLTDNHSFISLVPSHKYRLAAEVPHRRRLVDVRDRTVVPIGVDQLIKEFAAALSCGGDAQHPEILVRVHRLARGDCREIRGLLVIKG